MQAAQLEVSLLERNRQLRRERDDAREQRRRWQEASAADRVDNVKLRAALTLAKEKLALYRAQHSGEYVGGMEYTALLKMIDAALET